jgi:hypothetical protein
MRLLISVDTRLSMYVCESECRTCVRKCPCEGGKKSVESVRQNLIFLHYEKNSAKRIRTE